MPSDLVICSRADPAVCHDCECAVPHVRMEIIRDDHWCTQWEWCNAIGQKCRCTRVKGAS